jgi:transposase
MTSLDSLCIHASRKAWILTHGPITGDQCVNHKSKSVCILQAACCNPDHMYLGTRADNMVDRWTNTSGDVRGRGRPTALDEAQLAELWKMRREGATLKACAAHFGVHITTVMRYITAIRAKTSAKLRAVRMSLNRESLV